MRLGERVGQKVAEPELQGWWGWFCALRGRRGMTGTGGSGKREKRLKVEKQTMIEPGGGQVGRKEDNSRRETAARKEQKTPTLAQSGEHGRVRMNAKDRIS